MKIFCHGGMKKENNLIKLKHDFLYQLEKKKEMLLSEQFNIIANYIHNCNFDI